MAEIKFKYRVASKIIIFGFLFFAFMSIFYISKGLFTSFEISSLNVFGIILQLATLCVTVLLLWCLLAGRVFNHEIILAKQWISAPHNPLLKRIDDIAYVDIWDLKVEHVSGVVFLNIWHKGGMLSIRRDAMKSPNEFHKLLILLNERIAAVNPTLDFKSSIDIYIKVINKKSSQL